MSIDVSNLHLHNITDTCAVWNILSTTKAYGSAVASGIHFYCSGYVVYECLFRKRTSPTVEDYELIDRLKKAQRNNQFQSLSLDISDLQSVEIIENRKKLGRGEISSIALAMKFRQAFLTDDQKARRLAKQIEHGPLTQTVPHVIGWLFYSGSLSDIDKDTIIQEHEEMKGILSKFINEVYNTAMSYRLINNNFSCR